MKISPPPLVLAICLLLFGSAKLGAYNLENLAWLSGSNVVMRVGLGSTTVVLEDGLGSWNGSATDALDIWNGYLDFIHVSSVASITVPQKSGDGVNSVFFSGTVFGDSFGKGTLAVTVLLNVASRPGTLREADVVVNSAYRYNSYRGPLHPGAVYDLHRTLLHEFGHVLGLDHYDRRPLKTKIMESVISDWDHLGVDDIEGVRVLYGAKCDEYLPVREGRIGAPVYDSFTGNDASVSYNSTSLPPGLVLDSATGSITGSPTKSGIYNTTIVAHGRYGTAYAPFHLTVLGLEEIPGLLKIFPGGGGWALADPLRPRVYIGNGSISTINTQSLTISQLLPVGLSKGPISLSADSSKLFSPNYFQHEIRIDLASSQALTPLLLPADGSATLEGLNNQAYVAGEDMVYQFEAATGALQQTFAPPPMIEPGFPSNPSIAISADRRTLYVTHAGRHADLSSYDISDTEPVLLRQITGPYSNPVPSPDGQYLYYRTFQSNIWRLNQARLPDLTPTKSISSSAIPVATAIGPDGSIYECFGATFTNQPRSGPCVLYDPAMLQAKAILRFDGLLSEAERSSPYSAYAMTLDRTGNRLFINVAGGASGLPETWAFATQAAFFSPPPVHPTQNFLNISTRARVETGENVMIGGFVIQGTKPKKIVIRALGPSMPVIAAMDNPLLELYDSSGRRIATNDDWISNRLNIVGTLLAPLSGRESTLAVTLQPGAYTAIVRDWKNQSGVGLVEIYDVDTRNSRLANISTRGKVGTVDNVLIGGFIIGGENPTKVIIRAIGPSLGNSGIRYPLADPILELHDGHGRLMFTNDNWRSTQATAIVATGIAPTDSRESAILTVLEPGNYTAIVRGKNGASGVGLVEVYNLDSGFSAN